HAHYLSALCSGRLRPLDLQLAAAHLRPVEAGDRRIGVLGGAHPDEAETARLPGLAVRDDRGRLDTTRLREDLAQPLARGGEGETADEELVRHDRAPCSRACGRARDGAGLTHRGAVW